MFQKLKAKWQSSENFQFLGYIVTYFAIISMVPQLMHNSGPWKWLIWPLILLAQNFAFTFVSRARSSASLMRHAKASLMSNGIWIVSQVILIGPMFENLNGSHGLKLQMLAEMVYTVSTMSGALYAHYHALRTEKGKSAVGASKLYAQVPVGEWKTVQTLLHAYTENVGSDGLTQYQRDLCAK